MLSRKLINSRRLLRILALGAALKIMLVGAALILAADRLGAATLAVGPEHLTSMKEFPHD